MRVLKNIFSQLHRFVLCALLLSLFWFWIYTFLGDTSREKKILFYVDAYSVAQRDLSLRLEDEALPQGLKMVQARSSGYNVFGGEMVGDFYIIRQSMLESALAEMPEKFTPIELPAGREGYFADGQCWGILAFDAATQQGAASRYIQYNPYPEPEKECYYLCFDAASPHLAALPGAIDNGAWEVAMALLAIRD